MPGCNVCPALLSFCSEIWKCVSRLITFNQAFPFLFQLTDKGSDYQGLVDRHDEYQRRLETIHEDMV